MDCKILGGLKPTVEKINNWEQSLHEIIKI